MYKRITNKSFWLVNTFLTTTLVYIYFQQARVYGIYLIYIYISLIIHKFYFRSFFLTHT